MKEVIYEGRAKTLIKGKKYQVLDTGNISIGGWKARKCYWVRNEYSKNIWVSAKDFRNFPEIVRALQQKLVEEIKEPKYLEVNNKVIIGISKSSIKKLIKSISQARNPYVPFCEDIEEMRKCAEKKRISYMDEAINYLKSLY